MNATDRAVAARLAVLASDAAITYAPTGTRVRDGRGRVWYAVTATPADGRAPWAYYLRRDAGSYAGSFVTFGS